MRIKTGDNSTVSSILSNCLLAYISLVLNGLGVFLTIHAGIGAGPWDVFHIGISKTLGIQYGSASIAVSLIILLIDILMREPIGIAMFIDALTVGKAVDFFDSLGIVPVPSSLPGGILMIFTGLVIMGYTQYLYMSAALGCGPRDTLMVGLARHIRFIPIGVISIMILSMATLIGWLLGGPVGIGTIICAFCCGPIMQLCFRSVHFDATEIRHQWLTSSVRVLFKQVSSS